MEHEYILVQSTYANGTCTRTSFGIAVVAKNDESMATLETYADLSSNKTSVQELVRMFNEAELEPIHLEDIVQDFLSDLFGVAL